MRTFFEAQRYYRHMSHVYYGLFMVVALMQFLVTFFIVGLTVYVIAGNLNGYVAILICVGFLIYLGIGFFIAKKRVAQGGLSVAQSVKAVRLFVHKDASTQAVYTPKHIRVSNLRDLPAPYQRYYEFAAQMAIASGIVLPKLYVLPFESAVNGFVAGFGDEDRVMVLTQGAVEHLSNAELYGLIGHEFGHILHGDARLNLRLFVVLTTLTWCHELVDRIEMLAFGHFDRNYHGDHDFYGSWQVSNPVSKNEWMLLLTSHRRQTEAYYETHTASKGSFSKVGTVSQSAMHDAISARGLFGVVTFAIPLLFLKLISVVSLAGAEWLKQQFNRQREYLADATSVQLTRSPDVVNALQSLQVKYSTALYNKDFSTCMSHFFFASPEPDGVKIGMHTHPYIYERIDAIKFDHHLSFAQSVTAHLNHDSLQKAHDYAMAYHDIKETLKTSAPEPKEDTALAFEAPAERIIDGRLVIDDWLPEDSKRSQTLYPQQVTPHAITGIITPSQIKALALPWSITHNLTSITGIINLLECTLACHHYRTIDPDTKVDIRVLYTPRVIHLDARSIANTDPHSDTDPIPNITTRSMHLLPHTLPKELLSVVAHLDRRIDGLIIALGIKQLGKLLSRSQKDPKNATPIVDKTSLLLQKYASAFVALLQDEPSFLEKVETWHDLSFNQSDFKDPRLDTATQGFDKIAVLFYAATSLALIQRLDDHGTQHLYLITSERCHQILAWLGLNDATLEHDALSSGTVSTAHAQWIYALAALLALVVVIQDNSLATAQYERLTTTLRRWYHSVGLNVNHISYVKLVKLMYKVRALDSIDWLCVLSVLLPKDDPSERASSTHAQMPTGRLIIDTLHTAFIFDGTVGQEEYDLLNILALICDEPFVQL